jgi:hypothetical protein
MSRGMIVFDEYRFRVLKRASTRWTQRSGREIRLRKLIRVSFLMNVVGANINDSLGGARPRRKRLSDGRLIKYPGF